MSSCPGKGARDETKMELDIECDTAFSERKVPAGLGWRISLSILSAVVWVAFIITWLFFLASDYTIWENLGILLLSLVVLIGTNVAVWVPFGLRYAPEGEWKKATSGKSVASVIIGIAVCAFLIIWLMTQADAYTIYQNLAVILASIVIGGGLHAAVSAGKGHYCW
jgi:hypothetical protein